MAQHLGDSNKKTKKTDRTGVPDTDLDTSVETDRRRESLLHFDPIALRTRRIRDHLRRYQEELELLHAGTAHPNDYQDDPTQICIRPGYNKNTLGTIGFDIGIYPNASLRGAGENLCILMGRVMEDPEITFSGSGFGVENLTPGEEHIEAVFPITVPMPYAGIAFSVDKGRCFMLPARSFGLQALVAAKYIRRGFMVQATGSLMFYDNAVELWVSRQIVTWADREPEVLNIYRKTKRKRNPILAAGARRQVTSGGPRESPMPQDNFNIKELEDLIKGGNPAGAHSMSATETNVAYSDDVVGEIGHIDESDLEQD